jgi:hypothetical protein
VKPAEQHILRSIDAARFTTIPNGSSCIQLDSPVIKMDSAEILLVISCAFLFPFDIVKTCEF